MTALGQDTSVILVTYKIEHFKRLADVFGIWPYPRAHHNFASYVHLGSSLFVIADGNKTALACPTLVSLYTRAGGRAART